MEEEENELLDPDDTDCEPQLPEYATQVRVSGRKLTSKADDGFEQY